MADTELQTSEMGTEDPSTDTTEVTQEATDTTTPDSTSEGQDSGNWWDTSSIKDENAVKRIKSIQTEFQKRTERSKELERAIQEKEHLVGEFQKVIQETLTNPDKYREYRRMYGFNDEVAPSKTQPEPINLQKIQTPEDLQNALVEQHKQWQTYTQNEIQKVRRDLEQRIGTVAQPVAKQKWDIAFKSLETKYGPSFAATRDALGNTILNSGWKDMYGKVDKDGNVIDEQRLLEKVFLAEYPDEARKAIDSKRQASRQEKAKATTSKPTNSSAKVSSKGGTKEEIIARIRERFDK